MGFVMFLGFCCDTGFFFFNMGFCFGRILVGSG